MRRLPAKKYMNGKPYKMKRFLGRVKGVVNGAYDLVLWPVNKKPLPEIFVALARTSFRSPSYTKAGELYFGCPIELWTWYEEKNGRRIDRLHIKRLARS